MRVLVCGGRNYTNKAAIFSELNSLHRLRFIEVIIEGNASGVDRIAGWWARNHRIDNLKFPADWAAHGRAAGVIRNQRMLDEGRPDLVIAFPGGKGTADMVRRARAAGIEVVELDPR